MPDILIVKTSSLGDIVHMFPAVTDLARAHPAARIDWVVEEAFVPLAALHPAVASVIPVATRRWRRALLAAATWREAAAFRARLAQRRYDAVIDANGLIRSALIARLAQGVRHGYDARSIREPLASRFYDVRHAVSRAAHAIARNRALVAAALGYEATGAPDYGLAPPSRSEARRAVFFHGSAQARKLWPEASWIALGQALAQAGWIVTLPSGSAEEEARSRRLAAAIPGAVCLPRAPLDVMAREIGGMALAVGCDTGLLHLAAAYEVPLVGIFTASEPGLTGPLGRGPVRIVGARGVVPEPDAVLDAVRIVIA